MASATTATDVVWLSSMMALNYTRNIAQHGLWVLGSFGASVFSSAWRH